MSRPLRQPQAGQEPSHAPLLGTLVRVSEDGRPFVTFAGSRGEVLARTAISEPVAHEPAQLCGSTVLLVFDGGSASCPIIVGVVRERFRPGSEAAGSAPTQAQPSASAHKIHAASIIIEGEEEIVLRCGRGSICITADGRVVIKGTRLTSRASETNKVRGAVVLIN